MTSNVAPTPDPERLMSASSPRILGQYLSGGALEGLRRHLQDEECDDDDVEYELFIAREKIWEKIVKEAPSNHNWLDLVLPYLFDAKQGNDGGLSEFWGDMEGLMSDALRKHDTALMRKLLEPHEELKHSPLVCMLASARPRESYRWHWLPPARHVHRN